MFLKDLVKEIYLYHRFTIYYIILFCIPLISSGFLKKKKNINFSKGLFLAALVVSLVVGSMLMIAFSRTDLELVKSSNGTYVARLLLKETGVIVLSEILIFLICLCLGVKNVFVTTKKILYKHRFSLSLFLILLFQVFQSGVGLAENLVSDWSGAWYGMDYSLGFGSRLLVGSILKVLFPKFLTAEHATNFIFAAMLVIALLLAVIFEKLIENLREIDKPVVIFGIFIYLSTYGNLTYVGQKADRFEMIGFLFLLCAILSFFAIHNVLARTALVTVFSCLILLAHQGNFFLEYPVVIIITFMSAYRDIQVKFDKIETLAATISLIIVGTLFIYLQFYGTKAIVLDQSALEAYIQQRTDIQYSADALKYEYYSTIGQTYDAINKAFLLNAYGAELPVIRLVLQGVLLTPVLLIWFEFWKTGWCYYSEILKNKGIGRSKRAFLNPVLYVVLCFMMVIPEFVLNVDWVRWVRVIFIVQFATIFAMIYLKKQWAIDFLAAAKIKMEQHKIASGFLLVYLGFIGGFVGRAAYVDSNKLIDYFTQYLLR